MPKYLDQTGLATFKSKLDETYASRNNTILSTNTTPITNAEIEELFPGSGTELNIHYSSTTAPSDTSKLWVKTNIIPEQTLVSRNMALGTETISTLTTTLPTAASQMGSGIVGTKVYLFGGGGLKTIRCFDMKTEIVTTLSATLPENRSNMACGVVGTKIYLFGGSTNDPTSTIFRFDTETETLTKLSVTLPGNRSGMACGVIGTKIYLFGGYYRDGMPLPTASTIYSFDTETETITTLSVRIPNYLADMGYGVVGRKIYLFGGWYHDSRSTSDTLFPKQIYCFDESTMTISTVNTVLPFSNANMASAVVGTQIYLFGGIRYGGGMQVGDPYSTICKYDTETDTISTLSTTLPTANYYMASGVMGTKVYLFGGSGSSVIRRFTVSFALPENNMLLLDTGSNVFNLVNTGALIIEARPKQVYIGNANNEGEYVESALYTNGAWQPIG